MIPNDHISIFIVGSNPLSLSNTSGGEYARLYVDFKVSTV